MITVVIRPNPFRPTRMVDNPDYMTGNWRISTRPQYWRPPTDLFEMEDRFQIRVEISGMHDEDFEILLDEHNITIRGLRQDTPERRAYHQMEINFGEFATTVEIPGHFESSSVTAEYNNGFLWITLPKAQPKHIHISE